MKRTPISSWGPTPTLAPRLAPSRATRLRPPGFGGTKPKPWRRLTLALRALSLLALTTVFSCAGPRDPTPEQPRGVPVRTAAVERRNLEETLLLTGTLKPRSQVQVVAEVSARLLSVTKDEGSTVAKGEVLALLDDTDYRLAHERAKAALALAEANRAHAVAEKERAENLLKTGGITDKDHLAAEVNLQVAEAAVAQARAEAAMAGEQLQKCQPRAPFSGRVAKRFADPGAMLSAGTPIFTLVDNSILEFRASVPSASYGKLRLGAPVDVRVDAFPDRVTHGRVARIAPLVDERSRSFEIVAEVPGSKDLVGGLFARASVRVGQVSDALVVPPTALVRGGARAGEAEAFVVVDGKAEKRKVELGVEGPDAIQITKGLEAQDVVVLDPPVALASGAPVEIHDRVKQETR